MKLAYNIHEDKVRKKFECMEFINLFKLTTRVPQCKLMSREKKSKNNIFLKYLV